MNPLRIGHYREQMNKTHILVTTAALLALMTSLASITPLRAQTPDFNNAAAPLDICVSPGEAASYLVTVSSTGGFQGNVDLVESIDPNATNGQNSLPSHLVLVERAVRMLCSA